MPMMPISDRLQALLDRAREANKIESNRVSLEEFLAGLHQEDQDSNGEQLEQVQLAIYKTLLGFFNERNTATLVSQTTQAIAASTSSATQTDAATITLWGLLPKARHEAYYRGFDAGKDEGHVRGDKQGNSTGMTEGLAIGFEQEAEGLKMGLELGKEVHTQRGIDIGRKASYSNGLAEGMRQAREEMKNLGEEHNRRHKLQEDTTEEMIVVKLPPAPTASIAKKRNEEVGKPKPKSSGVDPFASLLGLVLKK